MCQFTDRFYSAVRRLAGDGTVKQRLLAAYIENLEMLPEAEVPESIRPRLETLRQAMHAVKPLRGESPAAASVRKMSPADATRHAGAIVAMFSELVRVKATGERLGSSKNGDSDTISGGPPRASLN
ncbi:MAG: hypothetical protein D6727_03070 [Gammaproteobacteria bacterium]|nr:MAG: hypothetical protein D6727_03070 [Gammaproteobacteria bacterium]